MKKLFVFLTAVTLVLTILTSCELLTPPSGDNGENNQTPSCTHENTTVTKEAITPTCISDGCTAEITCLDCGRITENSVWLDKDISRHGESVEIPAVAPTCNSLGSTAGEKCSLCQRILKTPERVGMTSHSWTTEDDVTPTCTEDGYKGGLICSVCKLAPSQAKINANPSAYPAGAKEGSVIPAFGHAEDAGEHITVLEPAVASTCIAIGKTAKLYCSICKTTVEPTTPSYPQPGHSYDTSGVCTTAGCGDVADYLNKYVSFLGDSITSYDGYSNNNSYNATLGQNGFYYNSSKLPVESTWWHLSASALKLSLCVNNSVDAGRVTNTKAGVGSGIDRAKNLHTTAGRKPDIIVIYLGTNDLANGIMLGDFKGAYAEMLYNIKLSYPDAEVFCCTLLPESRTPSMSELNAYNKAIAEATESAGYNLIDLAARLSDWNYYSYTINDKSFSVHPNQSGMAKMSEAVVAAIKEAYGNK